MTVVVDASVAVDALVDSGPDGRWAVDQLGKARLAAPHLMPVEVASLLRRAELSHDLSRDVAAIAHGDLGDLGVDLFPYEPFADRIWQLRHTVTSCDAWYVALAKSLDTTLITLDRRLAKTSGPVCRFESPASQRVCSAPTVPTRIE